MIKIFVNDINASIKIARICNDCDFNVDASSGTIHIDAKSVLGFQEMVGKTVEIKPITNDNDKKTRLFERLKELGAYEENY